MPTDLRSKYDYSYTPAGTKVGENVFMSQKEFDDLDEYSASQPSGVFYGKQWRRNNAVVKNMQPWDGSKRPDNAKIYPPDWWMAEYIEDKTKPGYAVTN